MSPIDTRELVSRLRVIESVAILPRVSSTNSLARRVVDECLANEIALPSATIIAREQTAGKGRGDRSWHSPPGGIYATTLHTRPAEHLPHLPLQAAVIVASFLRETYGLDARIKWPNDILVNGKKIAGILIEARTRDGDAYTLIGTGINVAAVTWELSPVATSIEENLPQTGVDLDAAISEFVKALDEGLAEPGGPQWIERWRQLSIHRAGDEITFRHGGRQVRGLWEGIDQLGRALIREGDGVHEISAADLILME